MRSTPHPPPARPPGRLRLTEEGVVWLGATALVGGLGWLKSMNLVLILAYGMAGLVVLNAGLAWWHGRRLTAASDTAGPVFPGEEVRLAVRVRNLTSRAADGAAVEVGDPTPTGWPLGRVPAGGEAVGVRRASFPARGRHPLPAPVAGSGFPFGFVRFTRRGAAGDGVLVLPAVGRLDPLGLRRWLLRQAAGSEKSRWPLRRATTDPADVRGVRPYRHGDGLRLVHWRSTARHRKLMVREYDAAVAPHLALAVDPWLPADPTPADRERLEAALSLAATVARTWAAALHARVTLWVAGADEARDIRPDRAVDRHALADLAAAEGGPGLPAALPPGFGRGQTVRLVVSSRAGSPLAAALSAGGRPVAVLGPDARMPWYQPPARA